MQAFFSTVCLVVIHGIFCQILNNTSVVSELEQRQLTNMDTYIEHIYYNPNKNESVKFFTTIQKYIDKLKFYVTKIETGDEDIIKTCTRLNDNEGPEFLKIGVNQKTFKEEMGWTDEDVEYYNNALDTAEYTWRNVHMLINNLDPFIQNITLKYDW